IVTTNSGALTITSNITGSGGLTLVGGGTLNLPAANAITGTTSLIGTAVNLGASNAFASGALTLVSGGLQTSAAAGLLFTNAVTISNANVTLGGVNPLLFSGAVTLAGNNSILNVTSTALTDFNGVISGTAFLTKAGAGTLTLSNNASTYTGLTFVNGGILQAQGTTALGAATAAAVVANGASVQL